MGAPSGGDPFGLGTRGGANTGGLGDGQAATESFDGQIAMFRVYRNQVLTPTEVLDNYNVIANSIYSITVTTAP